MNSRKATVGFAWKSWTSVWTNFTNSFTVLNSKLFQVFDNLDKNYEFYKFIKKIAIQLLKTFYFRARYLSNYLLCSPRPQLPERRAQNHTSRRQTVQYIGKIDFLHTFWNIQVLLNLCILQYVTPCKMILKNFWTSLLPSALACF